MSALPAGRWSLAAGRTPPQELVFVKLTDSALKALEDYIANQDKIRSTPTIQFLPGSDGRISIPNNPTESTTFRFTLSNNTDHEGPQASNSSFECLQTNSGSKSLRTLGPISTRMRVQANEDVYEATKHRMAVDAENLKSKCTRVIKPNQTDIGRKVKVKQHRPPPSRPPIVPPPSSQSSQPQHAPFNSHPSNGQISSNNNYQQSSAVNGYGGNGGGQYTNHQNSNSSGSSVNHNGNAVNHNGSAVNHNGNAVNHSGNAVNHNGNAVSYNGSAVNHNGSALNHNGNATSKYNGTSTNRPVLNKPNKSPSDNHKSLPIRERLIHILALRPYKKPELYLRLNSEGIKDKKRNIITPILQQIASLKDNCYHLHANLWGEVNEDWSYYTEEEKQILKRRKPQNLTPPLSSDSGHSPSPPPGKRSAPPQQPSNTLLASQPPPIKKQRISHYKKPQETSSRECGDGSPAALSNGYHSSTSMSGASSGERKNYSDEDTPPPINNSLTPSKRDNGYSLNYGTAKSVTDAPPPTQQNGYQTGIPLNFLEIAPSSPASIGKRFSPAQISANQPPQRRDKKSPDSTTQPTHSPAPVTNTDTHLPNTTTHLPPDYETQYIEINCPEQKRRYKTEFKAEYEEYRHLHARIEAVANKFTLLEERLNSERPGGTNHREIKRQILDEYQKMQQQRQRDLDKFNYLHSKLAHIKKLVSDYDRLQQTAPPPTAAY